MKNKVITIAIIAIFVIALILGNVFLNKQNEPKTNQITTNKEEKKVEILKVTSENFQKEVLESEKTVLIDFYADWCGPCKMLSPTVEEVANENEDIKVVKINIDAEQDLAIQYNVMSIPTLVVVKNGEETNRTVGAVGKAEILKMLK